MNLILNARGVNSIVVPITAEIDSIQIGNGSPGQFLTLLFIQDAIGHDVSAGGGNLQGFITPGEAAFDVTAESFTFNSQANTWVNIVPSSGIGSVSSVFGRSGVVVASSGDYAVGQITGAAPLASPALTGVPLAPTAAPGTNTTQLGTTAFVTAAVGVETARAEAAEALLAPLASPTFTGTVDAPDYEAGGTAGVTAGPFTAITGITVKGGIVTALTGS